MLLPPLGTRELRGHQWVVLLTDVSEQKEWGLYSPEVHPKRQLRTEGNSIQVGKNLGLKKSMVSGKVRQTLIEGNRREAAPRDDSLLWT